MTVFRRQKYNIVSLKITQEIKPYFFKKRKGIQGGRAASSISSTSRLWLAAHCKVKCSEVAVVNIALPAPQEFL